MSLASTRITCVTHRQKAANSSHPHCLGFATLYTYPHKGKNTHPETTLCFLQLHHIIFALFLCSSLFFMPFNQIGLASPQQIGFVISEMMLHEAEQDEVSSMQQTRPSPARAATLGLSFIPICGSLSHSRTLRWGCPTWDAQGHAKATFVSIHLLLLLSESTEALITKINRCTPGVPVWPNVRLPSIDMSVELHHQVADLLFRW